MPISSELSKKSDARASSTDEDFNYLEWYNQPGNSIREWNEAHGIHLVVDQDKSVSRYLADYDTLFADSKFTTTYPEYFKTRTIDRFNVNLYSVGEKRDLARDAYNTTVRYINHLDEIIEEYGGGGLYFYSKERGTGKTFLSTILGNELSMKGYRVRWYNMTNLIQEIKAGFDKESSMSSAQVIDQARNAQILILDDIGVEKQSAWLNETVYSILDHRISHCKPTIFTSNLLPENLSYDERIIDRITRMTELVKMPEQSIRRIMKAGSGLGAFLAKKEA